ncbi:MAG TPA: hypothetical protein VHY08_10905, partial [Bacillota bacterium]|nr:hypothetical protein [Bacillota bacterium]
GFLGLKIDKDETILLVLILFILLILSKKFKKGFILCSGLSNRKPKLLWKRHPKLLGLRAKRFARTATAKGLYTFIEEEYQITRKLALE